MKIIKIENPFEIARIIKMFELEDALHVTVSQTLLNAYKQLCGGSNIQFTTVEEFVSDFYPEWHGKNSINCDIRKLYSVNDFIRLIKDPEIKKTFIENKRSILKSVNTIIELNISLQEIEEITCGDQVLTTFYNLLIYIKDLECWQFNKNVEKSNKIIVFHSIHQFSSLILNTLEQLEKQGTIIYFMFNYQQKFSNVYETWNNIYSKFEIKETIYVESETPMKSSGIGANIGYYLNGNLNQIKNYNNLTINAYRTTTEFTRLVEVEFNNSKKIDCESPLRVMNTQFYSVNGEDANKLLKVTFPEQFKERHFLAYPLGQFFMMLYNCWDSEREQLIMTSDIKILLSYDIWNENPLEYYNRFENYIKSDMTLDEYINELISIKNAQELVNSKYKQINSRIKNAKLSVKWNYLELIKSLKYFPFLSYEKNKIDMYISVLKDIEKIASQAFKNNKGKINIKEHLNIIVSNIVNRKSFVDEEEKLINGINENIALLDPMLFAGEISELKESIHLFLNEKKENKNDSAKWIVRDLEQLDGEVLYLNTKNEYLHIAQLSNETLKDRLKDKEIWPLDQILSKLSMIDRNLYIYKTSKEEYKKFLKFMIFYGSYFSKKKLIFSYDQIRSDIKCKKIDLFENLGFTDKYEPIEIEKETIGIQKKYSNVIQDYYCNTRKEFDEINRSTNGKLTYYDLIQQRKLFKNMLALFVIDELILLYCEKKLLSYDKKYVDDQLELIFKEWQNLFSKLFSKWGKLVLDECFRDVKKNYLFESYNYFMQFLKSGSDFEAYLAKHNKYSTKRIDYLIYDPNRITGNSKKNDHRTDIDINHNIIMCERCAFRQECLMDYIEN